MSHDYSNSTSPPSRTYIGAVLSHGRLPGDNGPGLQLDVTDEPDDNDVDFGSTPSSFDDVGDYVAVASNGARPTRPNTAPAGGRRSGGARVRDHPLGDAETRFGVSTGLGADRELERARVALSRRQWQRTHANTTSTEENARPQSALAFERSRSGMTPGQRR